MSLPKPKMTLDKLARVTQVEFTAIRVEFNGRMDKMEEDNTVFRNQTLSILDSIVKKLDDLSTENTMGSNSYRRHDNQLQNHEDRISRLEKSSPRFKKVVSKK